jgi:hypothetical protein
MGFSMARYGEILNPCYYCQLAHWSKICGKKSMESDRLLMNFEMPRLQIEPMAAGVDGSRTAADDHLHRRRFPMHLQIQKRRKKEMLKFFFRDCTVTATYD